MARRAGCPQYVPAHGAPRKAVGWADRGGLRGPYRAVPRARGHRAGQPLHQPPDHPDREVGGAAGPRDDLELAVRRDTARVDRPCRPTRPPFGELRARERLADNPHVAPSVARTQLSSHALANGEHERRAGSEGRLEAGLPPRQPRGRSTDSRTPRPQLMAVGATLAQEWGVPL